MSGEVLPFFLTETWPASPEVTGGNADPAGLHTGSPQPQPATVGPA